MRTDINFKLICSRCGELLEADSENKESKINYHSAFNAEMVMAINPCKHCINKAEKPIRLIKEALQING